MKIKYILALLLAAGLALTLGACGAQTAEPAPEEEVEETVAEPAEEVHAEETETAGPVTEDEAVALALLDQAQSGYQSGECPAEGHIILGSVPGDEADTVLVYAQCSVGNYGFVNDNFEEVSGSGAIPSRLTFVRDENGVLTLTDFWQAEDGDRYADSIRETFPADLVGLALDTESYYPDLQKQKEAYARAYLEEIGRVAEIGEYADFEHPLACEQGMSAEASNTLMEAMPDYPFFLGSEERIEDGVRWVYTTQWAPGETEGEGFASYTKTNYDTGEVAESHVFEVDGDACTEVTEQPQS